MNSSKCILFWILAISCLCILFYFTLFYLTFLSLPCWFYFTWFYLTSLLLYLIVIDSHCFDITNWLVNEVILLPLTYCFPPFISSDNALFPLWSCSFINQFYSPLNNWNNFQFHPIEMTPVPFPLKSIQKLLHLGSFIFRKCSCLFKKNLVCFKYSQCISDLNYS